MKPVLTIVAVLLIAALIVWVRGGADFPIARAVPLLSGERPGPVYVIGGLIVLLLTAHGIGRLIHPRAADADDEPEPEEEDTDSDEEIDRTPPTPEEDSNDEES